mmetsp:Transcript_56622/g.98632  ORF Transcript_56622/g.98632 Transcript_56622/m.98632 type:complete len:872 (-) Transcript_56622:10-2625(-)
MNGLPTYQAAKYDSSEKLRRTRKQLSAASKQLRTLTGEEEDEGQEGPFTGKKLGKNEAKIRDQQKRIDELSAKLKKLKGGDLRSLLRYTHASKDPERMMGILRKRYPETAEDFEESQLPGEWEEGRAGQRMRLPVPPTWDRELSDKGNLPTTWAALLCAKERGRYTLPYMALLRNLRNILLMGLSPAFLRKHVLSRLPERQQIQGSGQTPVSLSHTWETLEKEFSESKLQEMQTQAEDGLRDILAYKLLLRKIRGPILGTSDKQVGIIGEFLGAPVWEPCGLKRTNECFLALNRVLLRDGKMLGPSGKSESKGKGKGKEKGKEKGKGKGKGEDKGEKWLPVAHYPLTVALLAEFKDAFDAAIQTAASCATEPICFDDSGAIVLWMDLSNPPLESAKPAAAAVADAGGLPEIKGDDDDCGSDYGEDVNLGAGKPPDPSVNLSFAGLEVDDSVVQVSPGTEVELDEITTHRNLNLELRYFCSSYLDYNIMAYDASGRHVWNSTYSEPVTKNEEGKVCLVHCRDIAGNPDPKTPALRTLHIDLDSLDEKVFAMMITSQLWSGMRPAAVSVALREEHNGSAATRQPGHEPNDNKGKVLLAQDISEPLKKGGTVVYACLYRDTSDPECWLFRNILDLSLASESRMARQITQATGFIFKKMFQESSLLSTMDANRLGYVRLCQLYQAVKAAEQKGKDRPAKEVDVHVILSGIRKRAVDPEVVSLPLTGQYVSDLQKVQSLKRQFTGKAVDPNASLKMVLAAAGCRSEDGGRAPAAVIRVANNSCVPSEELQSARTRAGKPFPYATCDVRGHIFDAFQTLEEIEKSVFVPGQIESCVTILRNLLANESDAASVELLVRYVDTFLPRKADEPSASKAAE